MLWDERIYQLIVPFLANRKKMWYVNLQVNQYFILETDGDTHSWSLTTFPAPGFRPGDYMLPVNVSFPLQS